MIKKIDWIFEEFEEVLDQISMSREACEWWKKILRERKECYQRPRRFDIDRLKDGLEDLMKLNSISSYRIQEEPTGEISVYIRPQPSVKRIEHIELTSILKKEKHFV